MIEQTNWRQIREAEDNAVLDRAHVAMCERIRELMPLVCADTARRLRWALLAGFREDTIALIDAAETEAASSLADKSESPPQRPPRALGGNTEIAP